MLDTKKIKQDFPILSRKINGKDLVYLDNSATSQKPKQVINAIVNYYQNHNANVHRGVHALSDESTDLFENSKITIANFFGANNHELIFVRNTTEAINGVAYGWGEQNLIKDDVILVTTLDHHSNIVVWQELVKRKNARLIFVGVNKDGTLDLKDFEVKLKEFGEKIKLVAFPHVSNALGTVLPVSKIVSMVKNVNSQIRILVDGAQSAPHMKIDFAKIGGLADSIDLATPPVFTSNTNANNNTSKMKIDFFTFSGHKMLGPMGVGGLLVNEDLLKTNEMQPWLFGGGMISEVHESHTNFNEDLSEKFIAGTPDVASVVGLAAACEYLLDLGSVQNFDTLGSFDNLDKLDNLEKSVDDDSINNKIMGMNAVLEHDLELVNYALEKLQEIPEITIVGPSLDGDLNSDIGVDDEVDAEVENIEIIKPKSIASDSGKNVNSIKNPMRIGSVSFLYKGVHAHDVAQVLDSLGVAVRSGHHCTMPLHTSQNWIATTRASFSVYNSKEDIDLLVEALNKVKEILL